MTPTVIEPIVQKTSADCGIAALAMFLGRPYAEVSEKVLARYPKANLSGLWIPELIRAAKLFDCRLKLVKSPTPDQTESATSLVSLALPQRERHLAVLFHGVLIDPATGLVWDVDVYCTARRARIAALLVAEEDADAAPSHGLRPSA